MVDTGTDGLKWTTWIKPFTVQLGGEDGKAFKVMVEEQAPDGEDDSSTSQGSII